jgi:hypothetical protein
MPGQRYGVAFGGAMPLGSNSHICPQERVRRVVFLSLRAQRSNLVVLVTAVATPQDCRVGFASSQ